MNLRQADPHLVDGICLVLLAGIAGLGWFAGYVPTRHAYEQDAQRAETLSRQVTRLETMVQSSGGASMWLAEHHGRLAQLQARFPSQDQLPRVLDALFATFQTHGLKLHDVQQGAPEAVEVNGQPVLIEGARSRRLPVKVTTTGRYRSLVQALQEVARGPFPGVVGLHALHMELKDEPTVSLEMVLQLDVYFL